MVKIKIVPGSSLIKFPKKGSEETIIVELQGSIETEEGSSLVGETVGEIIWDGVSVPSFLVGNHKLAGKIVDVNPPLALLQRPSVQNSEDTGTHSSESEYKVRAVITKKFKFTTRPIILMDTE